MSEEVCELGFLENGLYIEEVYLNMGDEVEAGEAVFKVSEESLEEARSELEKTVTQTALESRQGKLDYETGLEEAQKGKELAQIEAEWAQTVYDNAAAEAAEELESVQEQTDEAQKKADEYTASVEEDYYYTYYKVGELEEQWKDYAAFLQQLYTEWDVDGLESIFGGSGGKNGIGYVTNQVGSSGSGTAAAAQENSNTETGVFFSQETEKTAEEASESQETPESEAFPEGEAGGFEMSGESGMKGMLPAGANPGSDEIRYNIYLAMEEEAQECEAAYEEAKEQYEEAKETAQAGLAQAKSELAVLQAKLTKQQNTYEKALVEAQTAYDLQLQIMKMRSLCMKLRSNSWRRNISLFWIRKKRPQSSWNCLKKRSGTVFFTRRRTEP